MGNRICKQDQQIRYADIFQASCHFGIYLRLTFVFPAQFLILTDHTFIPSDNHYTHPLHLLYGSLPGQCFPALKAVPFLQPSGAEYSSEKYARYNLFFSAQALCQLFRTDVYILQKAGKALRRGIDINTYGNPMIVAERKAVPAEALLSCHNGQIPRHDINTFHFTAESFPVIHHTPLSGKLTPIICVSFFLQCGTHYGRQAIENKKAQV